MDPTVSQLSNTIATKLTAVEGTLKENITKLVKSKVRSTRVAFPGHTELGSIAWVATSWAFSPLSLGNASLAASSQSFFMVSLGG